MSQHTPERGLGPRGPRKWTDERIHVELERFLGDRDLWPANVEFERAGRSALLDAVRRHGGRRHWAERLGMGWRAQRPAPPDDYRSEEWDEQRIRAELREFLADRWRRGHADWPARRWFAVAGRLCLWHAAYDHRGIDYWALQFGRHVAEWQRPRDRYRWSDERIRAELAPLLKGCERWPGPAHFTRAGKLGLLHAVYRHGGPSRWASELGLREPTPQAEAKARLLGLADDPGFVGHYASCPKGGEREVRLEAVPGGFRLGEWHRGVLEHCAPVLRFDQLRILIAAARAECLAPQELPQVWSVIEPLSTESRGSRTGRSARCAGERREELRVEWIGRISTGIRIARWVQAPSGRFELRDAAPIFPIEHYVEAIGGAMAGLRPERSAVGGRGAVVLEDLDAYDGGLPVALGRWLDQCPAETEVCRRATWAVIEQESGDAAAFARWERSLLEAWHR